MMMVKKKKQATGGAGHPQDNKPRRDYISSPSQGCGCVHLIADRWGLGFCRSHPVEPEPLLSARECSPVCRDSGCTSLTCSSLALEVH